MQRRYLSPEDRSLVNRWRLILVGLYSSLAVMTLVLATANPVKDTVTAWVTSSGVANAADLRH